MTADLISNEKGFPKYVIDRLASKELDFADQMAFIRRKRAYGADWSASGILIPIEFDRTENEYVIILNKRSIFVQQPGDLCCPGGGMDRWFDRIMGYLLAKNVIPSRLFGPFLKFPELPGMERRVFAVILAGVLRESWEEMRLNPCNVECLGGLPTHQMQNFPRYIFPIVGRIKRPWRPRPNWEVERIVRVPIRSFLEPDNYATYSQRIPPRLKDKTGLDRWELPCLIVGHGDGEEVLWGATFKILLNFLQAVMDLPLEKLRLQRKIERDLPLDYFIGKERG